MPLNHEGALASLARHAGATATFSTEAEQRSDLHAQGKQPNGQDIEQRNTKAQHRHRATAKLDPYNMITNMLDHAKRYA